MGQWGKLLKELICSHVNYTFCGKAEEHATKSYLQLHLWGSLIYCVEQVMACWKDPKPSDRWTMGRGGHGQALMLPGHSAYLQSHKSSRALREGWKCCTYTKLSYVIRASQVPITNYRRVHKSSHQWHSLPLIWLWPWLPGRCLCSSCHSGETGRAQGSPRCPPAHQLSKAGQLCNLRGISFHYIHQSPSIHLLKQRSEADDVDTYKKRQESELQSWQQNCLN